MFIKTKKQKEKEAWDARYGQAVNNELDRILDENVSDEDKKKAIDNLTKLNESKAKVDGEVDCKKIEKRRTIFTVLGTIGASLLTVGGTIAVGVMKEKGNNQRFDKGMRAEFGDEYNPEGGIYRGKIFTEERSKMK